MSPFSRAKRAACKCRPPGKGRDPEWLSLSPLVGYPTPLGVIPAGAVSRVGASAAVFAMVDGAISPLFLLRPAIVLPLLFIRGEIQEPCMLHGLCPVFISVR